MTKPLETTELRKQLDWEGSAGGDCPSSGPFRLSSALTGYVGAWPKGSSQERGRWPACLLLFTVRDGSLPSKLWAQVRRTAKCQDSLWGPGLPTVGGVVQGHQSDMS